MVFAGNRASDGGLSGACHAAQPEDTFFVMPISPCHYLLADVDSGFWEAKGVVLLAIRIEGCLGSGRQQIEQAFI
jgi:hypothetical protein